MVDCRQEVNSIYLVNEDARTHLVYVTSYTKQPRKETGYIILFDIFRVAATRFSAKVLNLFSLPVLKSLINLL